jgi:RNA polymerase sigma-70 factor, ECF subfamily
MAREGTVEEPDPQVVAAARSGDLGAFEALVRRYQGAVWRLCFHLLHNESAADDATQEAFVRVFRFLRRYRGESKFSTWLFQVARNCAVDEMRRAGRRSTLARRMEGPEAPGPDATLGIEVREAVASLAMDLREPVVLIDVFGLPYREVSDILGVPEGTVKSRVHRARTLLAEALRAGAEGDARET